MQAKRCLLRRFLRLLAKFGIVFLVRLSKRCRKSLPPSVTPEIPRNGRLLERSLMKSASGWGLLILVQSQPKRLGAFLPQNSPHSSCARPKDAQKPFQEGLAVNGWKTPLDSRPSALAPQKFRLWKQGQIFPQLPPVLWDKPKSVVASAERTSLAAHCPLLALHLAQSNYNSRPLAVLVVRALKVRLSHIPVPPLNPLKCFKTQSLPNPRNPPPFLNAPLRKAKHKRGRKDCALGWQLSNRLQSVPATFSAPVTLRTLPVKLKPVACPLLNVFHQKPYCAQQW